MYGAFTGTGYHSCHGTEPAALALMKEEREHRVKLEGIQSQNTALVLLLNTRLQYKRSYERYALLSPKPKFISSLPLSSLSRVLLLTVKSDSISAKYGGLPLRAASASVSSSSSLHVNGAKTLPIQIALLTDLAASPMRS